MMEELQRSGGERARASVSRWWDKRPLFPVPEPEVDAMESIRTWDGRSHAIVIVLGVLSHHRKCEMKSPHVVDFSWALVDR